MLPPASSVVSHGIIFSVEVQPGRALQYCSQRYHSIHFNDETSFEQCAHKIRIMYNTTVCTMPVTYKHINIQKNWPIDKTRLADDVAPPPLFSFCILLHRGLCGWGI